MKTSVIVALIAAVAMTACGGASAPPTETTVPPSATPAATATPAPLLTAAEAQDKVQAYASRDRLLPSTVLDQYTHVVCGAKDDRYSPERKTWVIHCQFLDFDHPQKDKSGNAIPLYDKTYLLDDVTGEVRK